MVQPGQNGDVAITAGSWQRQILGQQRTDLTHVLAAGRQLNRLECMGETRRQALEALAGLCPEWLLSQITPD